MSMCGRHEVNFCRLNEAIYRRDTKPSCLTAIYDRDINLISEFCSVVEMPTTAPCVAPLFANKWLSFTPVELKLDIFCHSGSGHRNPLYISPGTTIFEIPENCEGIGQYYNIPVKFRDHSIKKVAQFFKLRMANLDHMFADNQWSIHELVQDEPLDLLPGLSADDDRVLKRLRKKMNEMGDIIVDVQSNRDWFWPVVIGLSCTFLLVLSVLIAYFKCQSGIWTEDRCHFRSKASDPDPEDPGVAVPMNAPDRVEEPMEVDEPLPGVGYMDIVA